MRRRTNGTNADSRISARVPSRVGSPECIPRYTSEDSVCPENGRGRKIGWSSSCWNGTTSCSRHTSIWSAFGQRVTRPPGETAHPSGSVVRTVSADDFEGCGGSPRVSPHGGDADQDAKEAGRIREEDEGISPDDPDVRLDGLQKVEGSAHMGDDDASPNHIAQEDCQHRKEDHEGGQRSRQAPGALGEQPRDDDRDPEGGEAQHVSRQNSDGGPNHRAEHHSCEPESDPFRVRRPQTLRDGLGVLAFRAQRFEVRSAQLGRKSVDDHDVPPGLLTTLFASVAEGGSTLQSKDREGLEDPYDVRGLRSHNRPMVVDKFAHGRLDAHSAWLESKGLEALLVGDRGCHPLDRLRSQGDLEEHLVAIGDATLLRHHGKTPESPEQPRTVGLQAERGGGFLNNS